MALEHHLVLPSHQMRVDHRQATGQNPLAHGLLALVTLADMERRCVDHGQQLGAGGAGVPCRSLKPGVFADQQTYLHRVRAVPDGKYTDTVTRHKIAPLVKHLVVGQFAFGVGVQHTAATQHAGGIEALLHRHRTRTVVAAHRVTHHHMQVF